MALLETVQDTFDGTTLDTGKWTTSFSGTASVAVANSTARLSTTGASSYANLLSAAGTAYNSSVYVRVLADPGTHAPTITTYLQIFKDTANLVSVYYNAGRMYGSNVKASVAGWFQDLGAYDETLWAYWRLSLDGSGYATIARSSNGATWTDVATSSTTASYASTSAQIRLRAGGEVGSYVAVIGSVNVAENVPVVVTPGALADTDTLGGPALAFAAVTPTGVADPETLDGPTASAAIAAAPAGIADADILDGPTLTTAATAAPGGIGDAETLDGPTVILPGSYGTGLYGQGVYGGTGTPPPTGYTNYLYGAGTYGEGPYYGYVGAPSDANPTDNPTYGTGTYGYGIYYGTAPTVKDAVPLFTDFAGTGQPPLHILGIGPWSPVIHWRGAANYGVGAGNLPARPALPLPPASSKGFTLRLDEGCEARFDLNLSRGSALIIDEMDTDLWWRRRDPRTKTVEMIGRFNVSHVNTSTSDTGMNVSVQCDDYKTVLGARMVLRYKDVTNSETQWDQGTPITEILKWAIPANTRLDLSELDTYDLGGVTATAYSLPPGTTLAEVFDQLNAVSPIRWEWWIETPNDINAAPKLRLQLGTRGLDKGVVLFDLGKGPTPITSWTRNTAADNYANSLYYQGGAPPTGVDASGGIIQTIPAQIVQYGQRDTTAGNGTVYDIQMIRARARTKLEKLASRSATYTIGLASGFWRGRAHIDVGDTVTLLLRFGKETLKEKHRVTEIAVDIDPQGAEEVTLTLGVPLPSPDPRSKRSPLQRIVRYLREYKAPDGASNVVTPDE